ncbi:MAG: type IIL restriction-modification enzyme MmeI [Trueperaceae bacterium]|nr:type IIL restriction-modification enzyme MmeI [Trueperaceae bacterium]
MFGLAIDEVRSKFPAVYQHVFEHVKPERDTNNRKTYRENWWIFGEARANFRPALEGLSRYIATVETSKHRFFTFLDASILPDNMLVNIALDDAYFLGILSSRFHMLWALAAGGRLGIGNDPRYTKTRCFEPFPFPDTTEDQKAAIRDIAESLDKHRKDRQAEHPDLTLTNVYNVLEKLRAGEALSAKDKEVHQQGLVSVLKELHDNLDAAVADAYGVAADLSDADILSHLVDLNKTRAEDEQRGIIHWLRPDYQNPDGIHQEPVLEVDTTPVVIPEKDKQPLPKALADQTLAVREMLHIIGKPATAEEIAAGFKRASRKKVGELLEVLSAVGQAQRVRGGATGFEWVRGVKAPTANAEGQSAECKRSVVGGIMTFMETPVAYRDIVEFIAQTDPERLMTFRASEDVQRRVADLVRRGKLDDLNDEERRELERYLHLEHMMRLVKARARQVVRER